MVLFRTASAKQVTENVVCASGGIEAVTTATNQLGEGRRRRKVKDCRRRDSRFHSQKLRLSLRLGRAVKRWQLPSEGRK